jgi:L-galactose dehydrogenase
VANPDIASTVVGTASPERIERNIREIEEPIDAELLAGVQRILAPVHGVTWPSGRPENN